MLKTYYPDLDAIEQQTLQLENESCHHCRHAHQLVSHGYLRKMRAGVVIACVGKRVFCSNRAHRTGCGRTMQLYIACIIPYLHYVGACLVAFVAALQQTLSIEEAYCTATGAVSPRNAYRWLDKLFAQLSTYRCLLHQPCLQPIDPADTAPSAPRRRLLESVFKVLSQQFGTPLCLRYQCERQCALV